MTDGQSAYYAARATETEELRVEFNLSASNVPNFLNHKTYDPIYHGDVESDEESSPGNLAEIAEKILLVNTVLQSARVSDEAARSEWNRILWSLKNVETGRNEGLSINYHKVKPLHDLYEAIVEMDRDLSLSPERIKDMQEIVTKGKAFEIARAQLLQSRHEAYQAFYGVEPTKP